MSASTSQRLNRSTLEEDKAMNFARFQLRMQRTIGEMAPRATEKNNVPLNGSAPRTYGEEYELIVNRPGGLL
jgi:hypothetical protein